MEPVDNDLGVGQESPGDVSEASVHVHDDVLHFVPVGEGAKIFLNGQGGSVRQDVEHAAIQRVCDDTLKGLAARVALEFVKGEGLRQSLRPGDGHDAQHAFHAAEDVPVSFAMSFMLLRRHSSSMIFSAVRWVKRI